MLVAGPTGADARPAPNVQVQALVGGKAQMRTTGNDGRYRFTDLPAGKYTVKVVAPAGYRVAGDDTVGVTLDGKRGVAVDFKLLSAVQPTPTAVATRAAIGATPASGSGAAAASPVPAAQGVLPGSVLPASAIVRASPVPGGGGSPASGQGNNRNDSALALGVPSVVVPLPSPVIRPNGQAGPSGPSRVTGPSGPVLSASPRAIPALPRIEDTQANLPPRRLVTSFSALSDSARDGAIGQLRMYASESSLVLGVPFKTQIDGTTFSLVNCGPASLAMVLSAYGVDVDPASVRDYFNNSIGNYNTELGTSLEHLGRIAREAGLSTLGLYGRGGYRPWSVNDVREYVRAGYPVITLTKYRKLPGHLGSQTDFDHYVVIIGLSGDDFVYNDAAFATDYGRNLVITPSELERAWAASSIPRHAMAVGLGESVRPLAVVPRRLQPETIARGARDLTGSAEAVAVADRADDIGGIEAVAAPAEQPQRMVPGRATQNLRERLLDELGARSAAPSGASAIDPLATDALAAGPNDDRALLHPSVALLHPTNSLLRPGDESLHPSDIRPQDVRAAFQGSDEARSADLGIDPAALANIRIPAHSEPLDGEVPTRLVLSDDDRARSDTEEMLTAGLPADLASAAGAAGGERASLGLHGGGRRRRRRRRRLEPTHRPGSRHARALLLRGRLYGATSAPRRRAELPGASGCPAPRPTDSLSRRTPEPA